jgi:phospholipid/cholesterol/gamma-HCH transport system substrate-binding protein
METKANHVLIGAATLIGAALAMLFAMWIARADFNRNYAVYDVVFAGPVRGLSNGAEVRFQGIKVGEVTNLRINPQNAGQVLARIRIDGDAPIRTDSVAQLEPIGLTGVNLIQLSGGSETSPLLRPDILRPPPQIASKPTDLDKIIASGSDIAQRANDALLAVQTLLTKENVDNVSKTIAHLEKITAAVEANRDIARRSSEAALALRDAGIAFTAAAKEIQTLTQNANTEFVSDEGLVAKVDGAVEALRAAAVQGEATLQRAEIATAIAADQNLPEIAMATQDLRRLSATLDQLAASLDRNPNRFVVGEEKPIVKVRP